MAHILVVDDDEAVRDLMKVILVRAGYVVSEAANGKEAMRVLRSRNVDLVVLDLMMPEMDGLEAISAIRRETQGVRVIAISGGGQIGNLDFLDFARKFGADGTLGKPFTQNQLLSVVENCLAASSGVSGAA